MNIQTLRMLILSQAVCLVPTTFAAVTINGASFDSFKMTANAAGDLTLTTTPAAAAGTIPSPLLKANYGVTVTSLQAGDTNVDILPGTGVAPVIPVNCVADPTNAVCPVDPVPPLPGDCSADSAKLVFETLTWPKIPMKIPVVTGKAGAASQLTTTTSTTYKGYFSAVADSASGNLTRRMWFSECPGGDPIVRNYVLKGITYNACDVKGVELKLSWSQEDKPAYVTTCKLERNKIYYLNYSQSAFGTGAGPTSTSKLYRGASVSGTP